MLTIKIEDLLKLSKYTDILLSEITVMTPNGMKKIFGVGITAKDSDVILLRTRKHELRCSPNHLIKSNNKWIKAKNLKLNDIIDTKYGGYRLEENITLNYKEDLLDIHVDTNEYYSNDILSHNSSIIDSFDYVLYNRVKGRKSKKTKLSSLPNRLNNNLEISIDFLSEDGTDVSIVRGYAPSKLILKENGITNNRAGKDKIDKLINKYIGLDYDTFKGFISMSINDFKNFISLSTEEKKLLLDKLFNLEMITSLNKILNGLISDNKKELEIISKEIDMINNNLDDINISIEKIKNSKKNDFEKSSKLILEKINNLKPNFNLVKSKLLKIESKKKELNDKILKERENVIEVNSEIKQINKQLLLFSNDKCPTCQADLNSDFHNDLKNTYIEKKNKFITVKDEISKNGINLKNRLEKLEELYKKGKSKFDDLNVNLRTLKKEYDSIQKKMNENDITDVGLEEFYSSINKFEKRLIEVDDEKSALSDKSEYHKILKSVLSEKGVKKNIINNIIIPINQYISENISKMHLPFDVILDDKFNATITSFGETIDVDTLSEGENKIINVCIMIAYLRLIRTKKQINVLFLDEVFSSIDVERINDVISLLRDLSRQSKINIFLVHHSVLNSQNFDKIYNIKKDVFSYITENNIDNE